MAHLNRERIPERVVHAKGAGAHGYFKVTKDVSKYTKAKVFNGVGKMTDVFCRFSTTGGEKGSADTVRDTRGFAIKFYTEDGVYDLAGLHVPVFFISDAIKFPDMVHSSKNNPKTGSADPDMTWDFRSLNPETLHAVLFLYGARGIPDGYINMQGFGVNTFKWVNDKGEAFFVKYHFKADQGVKNLSYEEAVKLAGSDPNYATEDLYNRIERGEPVSWTLGVQIIPEAEGESYPFDIYDATKVVLFKDYPFQEVG
mmetsp:Transcript_46089/g.33880  ORF Transcript_46089/g.33880 Transcript_46089/m.33880 type:complete len:255 (+) Transcript_46089:136-900(+)